MALTAAIERATVTSDEAARLLGVSRRVVHRAIARGELRAVRLGRRFLVLRADLERLISGDQQRGDVA